ncbi:hypothetical protein GCM10023350_22830 [Nocardioides endophyticus]|uniref:Pyridoxamine 5'-phosphate oxidase family protein n=1 Tax=Nocardioides endophyticus TaxID=1353775 RepID=A0ABP8YUE1_9ACTN
MSEELEPRVPGPVREAIAADAPLAEGLTLLLLTVRDDGWPHLAMLSVGEVVARDDTSLGLLLWPDSTATRNLLARGRGTLCAVVDGASWMLRLTVAEEPPVSSEHGTFRRFAATVVATLVDRAPYAELTSGVTFRLHDPDAVLPRWAATRQLIASPPTPTTEEHHD